jgi:hypothetical protein
MDPVSESFNTWIEGGGRTHIWSYDFEFYGDDPLEDAAEVDGGSVLFDGGSFKHVVEMAQEIAVLEEAVDAGETEEELYKRLIVPIEEVEKKKPKRGGGGDFRQSLLTMLDTLNLK